jgi:hypothetical protein
VVAVPEQLFARAKTCGLLCIPCEKGNHRIQPVAENPDWELILQRGVWMLVVRETPQIRFSYEEAMAFLNRFDRKEHKDAA